MPIAVASRHIQSKVLSRNSHTGQQQSSNPSDGRNHHHVMRGQTNVEKLSLRSYPDGKRRQNGKISSTVGDPPVFKNSSVETIERSVSGDFSHCHGS